MQKMLKILMPLMAAVAMFSVMGSARAATPLDGTQWELTSPQYVGLEKMPILRFSKDRVHASVGLNAMNGTYSLDGTNMKISPLASTRMAGPPEVMKAEAEYSNALRSVHSYALSANGQMLELRGDQVLQFRAAVPARAQTLAGTNWELTSPMYQGLEKTPFLRFTDDRLSASVGLNGIGGDYVVKGQRIYMGHLISTMMAGPPDVMTAERHYVDALNGTRQFKISEEGQTLTLCGSQTLCFRRVP